MHSQAATDSSQPNGVQLGQYTQDARAGMAPLFNAMNLQNPRAGRKYGTIDMGGTQRAHYQSPLVIPPVYLPMSPYGPNPGPPPEHMGPMPYLPTSIYPNAAMCPPAMPGYPMPYLMNNAEDQKIAGHENGNAEYYGPGVPPYLNGLAPMGPPLPYQMMKTSTGYMLQDIESLTQQDPAIPRAVPAMWTNPSELTLAKCLENREGITNVYIRGFLPETTDDMLHSYASRFGKIDRCKAIVDLDTGLCKG